MNDTRDMFQIRNELRRNADLQGALDPLTKGHQGAIVGYLNKYTGSDLRRQLALFWLFDAGEECDWEPTDKIELKSTKSLSNGEWHALSSWIDAIHEPDIDEWVINPNFPQEAKIVADYAEIGYYATNAVASDPLFDGLPPVVQEALARGAELKQVTEEPMQARSTTRFGRYKK